MSCVSGTEFERLWHELSAGAVKLPESGTFPGLWWRTGEGGLVGLRNGLEYGLEIDLRSGGFLRHPDESMRFVQQEEVASRSAELPHLFVDGYAFFVDDKPMWEFLKAARRRSHDPQACGFFLRTCCLHMLAVGAVPYQFRDGIPFGMDTGRWEALTPSAIADDIADATLAAPDVFEANIWWAPRRYT